MSYRQVRKTFRSTSTWTCPANVTQVTVVAKELTQNTIDAGQFSSSFIRQTGNTSGAGSNSSGQLGNNNTSAQLSPVATIGGLQFKQVTSSKNSTGDVFTGAITTDGIGYAWGGGNNGQLGIGVSGSRSSPVAITGGLRFRQIEAGESHMLGLTEDGVCYAWGQNTLYGALGDNTLVNKSSPVLVAGGLRFRSISAGQDLSGGITIAGDCYMWGRGDQYGQLGTNSTVNRSSPVQVAGGLKFRMIRIGSQHAIALDLNGAAYAWGYNISSGQLGDNTATSRSSPVAVVGGLRFRTVDAGARHSMGVTYDNVGYAWGAGGQGSLGYGGTASFSSPIQITGGLRFEQVAGAGFTSLGLTTGGTIYAWGDNTYGNFGNGASGTQANSPVTAMGGQTGIASSGATSTYVINVVPNQTYNVTFLARSATFGEFAVGRFIEEISLEY